VAALAAGLACAGAASAATNLVANGGFEAPSEVGQDYVNFSSGFTGWNVLVNNVDIVPYAGAYGEGAPSGGGAAQFLDLVGYGSTGAVSQDLGLVAGQTYNFSFDYANNAFSTSSASADVTLDGVLLTSVTHNTSTPTAGDWTHYSGSFVAGASGPYELAFTTTAGGNSGGIFLDNVSVSAVPEPATWALMLAGFGGLGAALRVTRRRRSPAAFRA
jgi:hypothetical protein